MDGWVICNVAYFSTVFQSYQDDGRVRIKSCVIKNSCKELFLQRESKLGPAY